MIEGRKRGKLRIWLSAKFQPFADITQKYHQPKIKMTRIVRIALLLLRIYLIVIIAILVFKFATSIG
jgi:hypothetical protein